MVKKTFHILCLLFFSIALLGQSTGSKDIIKLKQGHTVQGKIIEWVHDEYVIIRLDSGAEVKFPFESIETILQKELKRKRKINQIKEYSFSESGLYNSTSLDASLNEQSGYGLSHAIGWQFNRLLGIGIGSGLDSYTFNQERLIIPLFIEIRSFILKKNISPYVILRAGYGFALKNEENQITDADGGLFLNPEIGYRIGAKDGVNVMLGVGIKIQKATYTFEFPWSEQVNIDKMKFERFVLKFGVTF